MKTEKLENYVVVRPNQFVSFV